MGDANLRKKAMARLEALAQRVGGRNRELSQEEAEELADRFTREVIEEMIAEGKIKYERGTRGQGDTGTRSDRAKGSD